MGIVVRRMEAVAEVRTGGLSSFVLHTSRGIWFRVYIHSKPEGTAVRGNVNVKTRWFWRNHHDSASSSFISNDVLVLVPGESQRAM
jgi:hypothetical protein